MLFDEGEAYFGGDASMGEGNPEDPDILYAKGNGMSGWKFVEGVGYVVVGSLLTLGTGGLTIAGGCLMVATGFRTMLEAYSGD